MIADGAGVSFAVDNDLHLEKIQQLSVKIKLLALKPQIGRLFLCLAGPGEQSSPAL